MKFKKNLKRFWTLSRQHDGFTLVELIVVIAILAILAGVAVPAYSGYVTKAERAADEQLLSTINTAYASACLQNGTDMALLADKGASMPLTSDKKVDMDGVQPYGDEFAMYYSGNEDSAFKVFESIVYSPSLGKFCAIEDAHDVAISVNGKTYVVNGEDVAKLLDSTWAETMTSQELLDMVATNTALVSAFGAYNAVVGNDVFKAAASELLGMDYTTYLNDQVEAAAKKYAEDNDLDWNDDWDREDALAAVEGDIKDTVNSNMIIMVASKNAATAGESVMTLLQTGGGSNAKETLKQNVLAIQNGGSTEGLSQTVLAYGLYTSYVKSQGLPAEEEQDKLNVYNALEDFDDPDFQDYLTKQGQKDLDGLLAAMNVINTQDSNTVQSTVNGELNDADLVNVLSQILGK